MLLFRLGRSSCRLGGDSGGMRKRNTSTSCPNSPEATWLAVSGTCWEGLKSVHAVSRNHQWREAQHETKLFGQENYSEDFDDPGAQGVAEGAEGCFLRSETSMHLQRGAQPEMMFDFVFHWCAVVLCGREPLQIYPFQCWNSLGAKLTADTWDESPPSLRPNVVSVLKPWGSPWW